MRVVSVNLNGVRSAARKGFALWLEQTRPDVVCCQEVRARQADIPEEMRRPAGLRGFHSFAQKPGYAGVSLYCRRRPLDAQTRFGHPLVDGEGRYVCAEFKHCRIVSFYMPSGSSGGARQQIKEQVMDALYRRLAEWSAQANNGGKQTLLCGDINIAHTEKDIRNWRGNLKNSGFLPHEREWLGAVFGELGWRDVFRQLNDNDGEYSWWSNRGRARENNVGWRIDYHLATPLLAKRAKQTEIYRKERFSDHAPVVVYYRFAL